MHDDHKHPKAPLIGAIALIIMPLMGACIDVYTPSLPAIQTFFGCTIRLTQFTITFYIISYGIFQLLFGTLSDILGRKRLLMFGCALFTLASLLAPLSPSILLLILFRALQVGLWTDNTTPLPVTTI
ncbi:MAG: multidrug effflux MFS transporter [Gammaproteobacteria bacterium]|nr:multidrug effflux MFS transporter [Gammaproteobacteria bacterium]